jgi:hypothetical protein
MVERTNKFNMRSACLLLTLYLIEKARQFLNSWTDPFYYFSFPEGGNGRFSRLVSSQAALAPSFFRLSRRGEKVRGNQKSNFPATKSLAALTNDPNAIEIPPLPF